MSQNYLGLLLNAICMGFREVSDYGWEVVRPFLPPRSRVGSPRADGLVGYDGFKHRKGTKIHAVVDPLSKPLYFTIMSMTLGGFRSW
jgi:hypothetical protein